jgi:hypothetical protein
MLLCVLTGPYISLCPLTCDSAQGRRSEAGDREKVVSTYTPPRPQKWDEEGGLKKSIGLASKPREGKALHRYRKV